MFNGEETRPPPPTGRPPPYEFVRRVYKRTLRPIVIFCAFLALIWALAWVYRAASNAERDGRDTQRLVPIDITLACIYGAGAAIEIFGLFACFKANLKLVRTYAWLTVVAAVAVLGTETLRIVVHFIFKNDLIEACAKRNEGRDLVSGGVFDPQVDNDVTLERARELCTSEWKKDIFGVIAWMIVATILAFLFSSMTFSYYRELLDPSSVRERSIYQLQPTRHHQHPIPGYNPYNNYPDYVPPYDPPKPPGYSAGGWQTDSTQDLKTGPFGYSGAGGGGGGYSAPAGPPPGLGERREESRDEGFDPAMIQAAMRASENEQKDSTTKPDNDTPAAAGPSSKPPPAATNPFA